MEQPDSLIFVPSPFGSMSKASRRKRRRRKQLRQSNQYKRQVVMRALLDQANVDESAWEGSDSELGSYIQSQTQGTLEAYRHQPNWIEEHANQENDTTQGGYAHRQLFELVQNSADSLAGSNGGRISLKLTHTHLYCADDGRAISKEGVSALMTSHRSPKRGTAAIGRFGMGFKAVLGVTNSPEFFSHSGSFRFDKTEASRLIRSYVSGAERCPVLRLAYPVDPWPEMDQDSDLHEFMGWATNIVRLPLKLGAYNHLVNQFGSFPPEFLLFVEHVAMLSLKQAGERERVIEVQTEDGLHVLSDGDQQSQWRLFDTVHKLSTEAKNDNRRLDDVEEVPIVWAVPLEQFHKTGKFWAFFPTLTTSLLVGILNSPWKTNEDRQNLLQGGYNEELIKAASELIAESITELSSREDPGRHLDALPRRQETDDNDHSKLLRDLLNHLLGNRPIVPDQYGELRKLDELNYQPEALMVEQSFAKEALDVWETFSERPANWLHHGVLRPTRLAAVGRLDGRGWSTMAKAEVSKWLEHLVQSASNRPQEIEASKAAIQAAAKVQDYLVTKGKPTLEQLGCIVLTANGSWTAPDPDQVSLGGSQVSVSNVFVHPLLEQDSPTKSALERLGIKPQSMCLAFNRVLGEILKFFSQMQEFKNKYGIKNLRSDPDFEEYFLSLNGMFKGLWAVSRILAPNEAADVIQNHRTDWRDALPVLAKSGNWHPLTNILLPGKIVPGDDSRDADIVVDIEFHRDDLELLKILDAVSEPVATMELSTLHNKEYLKTCQFEFQEISQDSVSSKPRKARLKFKDSACSGPLDPITRLSKEGCVRYTWLLLDFETTYTDWIMSYDSHDSQVQSKYKDVPFQSPAIERLRNFGMVRTTTGIARLSDGIGRAPSNPEVVDVLLLHPKASRIRQAFGLHVDLTADIEPVGEDAGEPLVDYWPALQYHLSRDEMDLQLVRCKGFRRTRGTMSDVALACEFLNDTLFVVQQDDEARELTEVLNKLNKPSTPEIVDEILNGSDALDVRKAIEVVRQCDTDEERLLAAVGVEGLKRRLSEYLPPMLTDCLGINLARAAIAKFHTGALEAYKDELQHLRPPRMWAGTTNAVRFVQSLGFDEEWAGSRNSGLDPYVEVAGPKNLPSLHHYQELAVQNIRNLVATKGAGPHRGLLSMPTGAGKTRVAVQALVEAIRADELQGGILWVADREELCEQAVESWQEVWASEGKQISTLRISRMWGGVGKRLLPASKRHVIVASIQTLHSQLSNQSKDYRFLSDFKLVVIDEAHRSTAPTYTSVLQRQGLSRWYQDQEAILIGLTATPYRGSDVEETKRLLYRYDHRRLDDGVFPTRDSSEVVQYLQEKGILALADHATIDGGEFYLSDRERKDAELNPWLPRSVENRIARSTERTQRIVDEYKNQVKPDWPTLIFATSVEHSEIVAALLNAEGIAARAVSGSTKTQVRRRIVEEFRSGSVKVLVNYGVFREGFDAPKTRAIVVARPVYSPNLYFQMIGRGLRGAENGGNERCLILNVSDNIHNFGQDLAFTGLDWLWAD